MPSEHHEVVVAKYKFAGTIVTLAGTFLTLLGTLATAAVGLYTAGKKVNEVTGHSISIVNNFQAGLTLALPSKPLQESLPDIHSSRPDNQIQRPTPVPVPTPSTVPTPTTAAGTCSGLDKRLWNVEVAPVVLLKGKDPRNQDLTGYNINFRLGNLSDQILYVRYVTAELTDSLGSMPGLSSASLADDRGPGIAIAPGSSAPVNLKFLGLDLSSATTVSFSINLRVFTSNGKPEIDRIETFACTSLPA